MKTILIIIAGMADLPDPGTLKDTPLTVAKIPALDMLARRGELMAVPCDLHRSFISHKNALLSVLGYDLERSEPSTEELMEFGLDNSSSLSSYPSLRPFVIPGFSGHGVCVTSSAWVRGVAKCALLDPTDIYSPGSSDAEILDTIAQLTNAAIVDNEFVLVYVDSPLKASLKGDFSEKVKALEIIDRHLISPVADFVWKSELLLQLAITSDLATPWHRRKPSIMRVPTIFYFNNEDTEGAPEIKFTEVGAMLTPVQIDSQSAIMRHLINFTPPADNFSSSLPF